MLPTYHHDGCAPRPVNRFFANGSFCGQGIHYGPDGAILKCEWVNGSVADGSVIVGMSVTVLVLKVLNHVPKAILQVPRCV